MLFPLSFLTLWSGSFLCFLIRSFYVNEPKRTSVHEPCTVHFIAGWDLLARKPTGAKLKFYTSGCFKYIPNEPIFSFLEPLRCIPQDTAPNICQPQIKYPRNSLLQTTSTVLRSNTLWTQKSSVPFSSSSRILLPSPLWQVVPV